MTFLVTLTGGEGEGFGRCIYIFTKRWEQLEATCSLEYRLFQMTKYEGTSMLDARCGEETLFLFSPVAPLFTVSFTTAGRDEMWSTLGILTRHSRTSLTTDQISGFIVITPCPLCRPEICPDLSFRLKLHLA